MGAIPCPFALESQNDRLILVAVVFLLQVAPPTYRGTQTVAKFITPFLTVDNYAKQLGLPQQTTELLQKHKFCNKPTTTFATKAQA